MNPITLIKSLAVKGGAKVSKYSPEILLVAGVAALGAGIFFACKQTLKLDSIIEKAEEDKARIENADLPSYSDADKQKDMLLTQVKTGVAIVKNYALPAALIAGGFACVLGSYGILKKRNVALIAAYNAVDLAYRGYRKKVIEEIGEERERDLFHGAVRRKIDVIEKDEATGKETKKKVEARVTNPDGPGYSPYARFFDEYCQSTWKKDPEYNLMFLNAQQKYATDLLRARGHLFLNEVYDMLGIPRSREGAIVGWIMGAGDDYVDFGIYDGMHERARDFVNGYEPSILLDFNVDGVIWDKI